MQVAESRVAARPASDFAAAASALRCERGVALRGHGVQSSASSCRAAHRDARQPAGARAGAAKCARDWPPRWDGPPSGSRCETIRTTGDMIRDRPLAEAGGKGLFTKEIEEALLAGAVDLAVHSAKDMPTAAAAGLAIAAVLPREDARDVFISRKARTLRDLPAGASVGTASLRRQALVKRPASRSRGGAIARQRGDAAAQARGRRGRRHPAGACRVAAAGARRRPRPPCWRWRSSCRRSGRASSRSRRAPMIARVCRLLDAVDHADTAVALAAERAFLAVLDGSCRTPIAGHATVADGRLAVSRIDRASPTAASAANARGGARRRGGRARRRCRARAQAARGAGFFPPSPAPCGRGGVE